MRRILIYATILTSFLVSCHAQESSSEKGSEKKDKKLTSRDYSINPGNAYNDLFLDSTTVINFIKGSKVPDSLAKRIVSFYNARNYQFAWFSTTGLTEQARGFWNLHDYNTTYKHDTSLYDKKLQRTMDDLTTTENLHFNATDKGTIQTELTLTEHFIHYMLSNYEDGYIKRKEMERFIPIKKADPLRLADSILTKKHKDNKYFEDVNQPYKFLKNQLALHEKIVKNGGWPLITASAKSLKKGVHSPAVALLKKRLQISGDLQGGDTSQVFDDTLTMAVKNYQEREGYTANGVVSDVLLKDLNVPAQARLEQIMINMERMRWMSTESEGNLIVVNLPEFVLHVYEGNKKVFDMNVVVGKEGHTTTVFNGDLNQIVFSPYWNVPPSIVKDELMAKMASNPNYLESQHMEQIGTEGGLPKIRQIPGEWNSLGRVKFLFPNNLNIYFHDTNAKSLFSKDRRAYSHGCIRLAEPQKMAEYLLRNQPEWTPDKIDSAMTSGKEQIVRLKKRVPVVITYYTAWVDDNGRLNFRDDIYGHDKELAQKMFTVAY